MKEFTIFFQYNNEAQKAGVLKKVKLKLIEYDVRPLDPIIVRKYGQQIKIIKEHENYRTYHPADFNHNEFFRGLIAAIEGYEDGELQFQR